MCALKILAHFSHCPKTFEESKLKINFGLELGKEVAFFRCSREQLFRKSSKVQKKIYIYIYIYCHRILFLGLSGCKIIPEQLHHSFVAVSFADLFQSSFREFCRIFPWNTWEQVLMLVTLALPSHFYKARGLHKKWSFPLRISSVNVTKSAGKCGFGHIYWRNP